MVEIRIVSARGHDIEELEAIDALERLKTLSGTGKWTYIDGEFINNVDTIDIADLQQAESITVTNEIIGG